MLVVLHLSRHWCISVLVTLSLGGGPTDPILLENKKQLTGWQPYSIRLGDTYYSYDSSPPGRHAPHRW